MKHESRSTVTCYAVRGQSNPVDFTMTIDPKSILSQRFKAAIAKAWGDDVASVDPLIASSNNPKFGDYQANVAMSLGKRLGSKPHDVAKRIVELIELSDIAAPPTIAGPGFINVKLTDSFVASSVSAMTGDARLGVPAVAGERVVIDYSGPNVAKEMHVGHLRSTIIGDALSRVLEFRGDTVIRQNHMGDWGTQFGMLIEFLVEQQGGASASSNFAISDLNGFYQQAKKRFDEDPAFAEKARHRVVMLQGGDEPTLEMWRYLIDESKKHFNAVYRRLNVLLNDEDVMAESAYNPMLGDVVSELESKGLVQTSEGATCVFVPGYVDQDGKPLPLIIRKSDGGFLYATTDLAALRYRVTDLKTTRMIYVTDARQKQHFAMVFRTAQLAGWLPENHSGGARAEHVPFGTVLGEDNKPFKTRSGEVVKLTDLLDEAEERALAVVTAKQGDLDAASRQTIARVIGLGAVKYADLSNDRVKDYVFSWDRMLSFDGNTAPYLVNGYVRVRSIFRKANLDSAPAGAAVVLGTEQAERALAIKLLQWPAVIESVATSLEPHRLCTYLYELASAYHAFYEKCPVLTADSQATKNSRLVLCEVTSRVLKRGLELLGIEVVEKM